MEKPEFVIETDDYNDIEIYHDRIEIIYECGYCVDSLHFAKLSDTEIDKIIKLLQNAKDRR